jgi:hypothetical protein
MSLGVRGFASFLFASPLFPFSFAFVRAAMTSASICFVFFVFGYGPKGAGSVADEGEKRVGEGNEANGHVVLDHVDPMYSGGRQLLHHKAVRVLGRAPDGRVDDLLGGRRALAPHQSSGFAPAQAAKS